MKKSTILMSLLTVVFLSAIITGCDNRSQTEKDIDKAASGAKKAAADAQKKMGM